MEEGEITDSDYEATEEEDDEGSSEADEFYAESESLIHEGEYKEDEVESNLNSQDQRGEDSVQNPGNSNDDSVANISVQEQEVNSVQEQDANSAYYGETEPNNDNGETNMCNKKKDAEIEKTNTPTSGKNYTDSLNHNKPQEQNLETPSKGQNGHNTVEDNTGSHNSGTKSPDSFLSSSIQNQQMESSSMGPAGHQQVVEDGDQKPTQIDTEKKKRKLRFRNPNQPPRITRNYCKKIQEEMVEKQKSDKMEVLFQQLETSVRSLNKKNRIERGINARPPIQFYVETKDQDKETGNETSTVSKIQEIGQKCGFGQKKMDQGEGQGRKLNGENTKNQ